MFIIGISLLVSSPIAWVMERILAASARTDPVFERQRAVAERMVVPVLLAGLIHWPSGGLPCFCPSSPTSGGAHAASRRAPLGASGPPRSRSGARRRSGSAGSPRTRRSGRRARSRQHKDVEQLGATGGAERVKALPKCLLQLMQGRHRVNDRFEDLRSVPERREALPGTRRAGEGLGTAFGLRYMAKTAAPRAASVGAPPAPAAARGSP
jgi:hypothetical protein